MEDRSRSSRLRDSTNVQVCLRPRHMNSSLTTRGQPRVACYSLRSLFCARKFQIMQSLAGPGMGSRTLGQSHSATDRQTTWRHQQRKKHRLEIKKQ